MSNKGKRHGWPTVFFHNRPSRGCRSVVVVNNIIVDEMETFDFRFINAYLTVYYRTNCNLTCHVFIWCDIIIYITHTLSIHCRAIRVPFFSFSDSIAASHKMQTVSYSPVSNRNKSLAAVQNPGNTDPQQGVPAVLQQLHKVRVHLADFEVERKDLVQQRVANVHDDRVHATVDKRAPAPPALHIDEQEAQRQCQRGHGCRDEDKGQ